MRKILLIICIAFVVVCYGYPCFILPFGEYKYTTTVAEETVNTTFKFDFKGKVKISSGESSEEMFYKLKGNTVILSEDETFDDSDTKLNISNMYSIGLLGENAVNQMGMWSAIGVGVLALLLVVTIPKKSN